MFAHGIIPPDSLHVLQVIVKMNKVNLALFFAALLVVGACAAPRRLLVSSETQEVADAAEHQRILEELETVSALRERMLAEGKSIQLL